MNSLKKNLKKRLEKIFASTIFRYAIAGGLASLCDVLVFNGLISFVGLYYLSAAIISNTLSFFIRFFLQKQYAFRASGSHDISRQFFSYGIWFLIGLVLTSLFLFIFVDGLHMNQSVSQIIAILLVAIVSFFIYRHIIFPEKKTKATRILVFTQKVNKDDPILGFFHRWIAELSKHFETVMVVCLEKGEYDLPENVKVFSLGKEERQSRLQYLVHFYWYILYERKNYDAVFVHMNQEYIILGSILWRLMGKRIYMWRNHRAGNFITDLAILFCHGVFCTSKYSYTARSKKVSIMPVGIDTELFKRRSEISKISRSILFLGRISPIKKPDLLLKALYELRKKKVAFTASFYGDALSVDLEYYKSLQQKVKEYDLVGQVTFYPGVANEKTIDIYNSHEIFINLTSSGSYDKTIFEAMACETLVLASNKDLHDLVRNEFVFKEDDAADLSQKLENLLNLDGVEKSKQGEELRTIVIGGHSLRELAAKLYSHIQ